MAYRTSLLPTVSRFFDDFFTRDLSDWNNNNNFFAGNFSTPAVNIVENGDKYVVEVAAPGLKKEDFSIEIENNILSIRAERKFENENKDQDRFVRREFGFQSFRRSFHLDQNLVDRENISAQYEDGVLRLSLPKREEAKVKPTRRIEIG